MRRTPLLTENTDQLFILIGGLKQSIEDALSRAEKTGDRRLVSSLRRAQQNAEKLSTELRRRERR